MKILWTYPESYQDYSMQQYFAKTQFLPVQHLLLIIIRSDSIGGNHWNNQSFQKKENLIIKNLFYHLSSQSIKKKSKIIRAYYCQTQLQHQSHKHLPKLFVSKLENVQLIFASSCHQGSAHKNEERQAEY